MVDREIQEFVLREIVPQYDSFDGAHRREHVFHVIEESLKLAAKMGVSEDMAYVVAAYHDLGLSGSREEHHLISGKIIREDERLRRWFTPEQIETMAQAAEDHRASAKTPPRSLYGMIVSEADRDLSPETVIRRMIQYSFIHYPSHSREDHYARVMAHTEEKYGPNGYLKLWIPGSENEEHLRQFRDMLTRPGDLRALFDRLYDEELARLI